MLGRFFFWTVHLPSFRHMTRSQVKRIKSGKDDLSSAESREACAEGLKLFRSLKSQSIYSALPLILSSVILDPKNGRELHSFLQAEFPSDPKAKEAIRRSVVRYYSDLLSIPRCSHHLWLRELLGDFEALK